MILIRAIKDLIIYFAFYLLLYYSDMPDKYRAWAFIGVSIWLLLQQIRPTRRR